MWLLLSLCFLAKAAVLKSSQMCAEVVNQDCAGADLTAVPGDTVECCCNACQQTDGCAAYVFAQGAEGGTCYLKSSCRPTSGCKTSTCTAGILRQPLSLGVCPVTSGFDCAGEDLFWAAGSSADDCCGACQRTSGCGAFVFAEWKNGSATCYFKSQQCTLKASCGGKRCTTGVLPSAQPPGPSPPAITPLSWKEARKRASALVQRMQRSEKYQLMRGIGAFAKWNYAGNTVPVARLGVPALNMHDSSAGFRTTSNDVVGTVTCWPSLLSMAATWDMQLMLQFATAVGEEFSAKGANMILGPSINVHRQGLNGRNYEYLSAEDPFLGARLTEQYVKGVQSQGVMAVMKHFAFNHQQTNSRSFNAIVDDKTAWELYYPPYQAAVDAGASATMCAYNRDDGAYTCANGRRLVQDLKGTMGFQGFVQSDWGATSQTAVAEGLDQDMPGDDGFYDDRRLAGVSDELIDEAATRALASMQRLKLFDNVKCNPENQGCKALFDSDVRGAHAALARQIATESVVLLKNEGVLPLSESTVKKIAVVGAAAASDPYNPNWGQWFVGDLYSGGGSGHVVAGRLVKPLDAIRDAASQRGMSVIQSVSDDAEAAVKAAGQADVTIIVAGTTSGESRDRSTLKLDGDMDTFIPKVASASCKTVVLAQIPGAMLTDWRDSADAILALFLGGDETGNAWASVLFGEHAPSGHLPVMLPASGADTIPIGNGDVHYSEGMATSYRNGAFKAAFPFGHGLTYTTFEYGSPSVAACEGELCVKLQVSNTGSVAASTVAQLYLEFPACAKHPAPLLKAFSKTSVLKPGQAAEVVFVLEERNSLSYWENGTWVKAASAVAHIGASSADVRVSIKLNSTALSEFLVI